ncbi:anti-sigma B factor antagonist [Streptomyces sp. SAI-208]|uniref:STAS domain-containing protein n=1 Tax=unclassified Streptomyces TaxID=2593676 RepID=UPI002473C3FB|nr:MULTISPECIES: STAS domain-containing protein [unclassified Streptomyces]MDH6588927.1 anti-sigma B factor antagonist [Streptomyces sp. SAI-133]MDH6605717.1 anti-sigma B factor antagonist [Streptomyces sp. SAI-208]
MSAYHTRSALSRTVRTVGGTTTVTLEGELDLVTAMPLTAHLDTLTSGPHPDLVLDLRPVSFIDCAGLAVLCRARKRARALHGRLRLVTSDARFLRILRATGLGGVFEIHPDLPATEAATPAGGASPSAAMG